MEELILFGMCFILVFIIYEIFVVSVTKRRRKKGNYKKEPLEITYLKTKYHLNMKKVNYNQLLQIVAIVSSFDIALAVSIINRLDGILLELVGGFFILIIIILISYHLVYLFYKKKGMINNE